MDLSKFKTSDWLKVAGGLGILIFGFLDWVTVDYEIEGFGGGSASGGNVFDFFFTGTIPWILIIGTAVVTVLLALGTLKPGGLPWTLIMLAATALALLLLLIRVLFNPIDGSDGAGVDIGRGIGMWLSFLAGVAAFVGAFLGFKESGGDLNDLKDMNRIKSQFGGGTSAPPPPPPSGMTPPPPPPPAG